MLLFCRLAFSCLKLHYLANVPKTGKGSLETNFQYASNGANPTRAIINFLTLVPML